MVSFEEIMIFHTGTSGEGNDVVTGGVKVKKDIVNDALVAAGVKIEKDIAKDHNAPGASLSNIRVAGKNMILVPSVKAAASGGSGSMTTKRALGVKKNYKVKSIKFVSPKLVKKGDSNPIVTKSDDKSNILNDLHFYKNKQSAKKCPSKTKPVVVNKPNLRNPNLKKHSNSLGENVGQKKKTEIDRVEIEENMSEVNDIAALDVTEEVIIETENSEQLGNETNTKDDMAASETSLDKKPYKCDKCEASFAYLRRLSNHQEKGTCNLSFLCSMCNVKLNNLRMLKRHMKRYHENTLYRCASCPRIFRSEKAAEKHTQSFHTFNQCKFCLKMLKNANCRRSHVLNCKVRKGGIVQNRQESEETVDYPVTEASTSADHQISGSSKDSAEIKKVNVRPPKEKETEKVKNKETKMCHVCNKVFKGRSGLWKHLRTHTLGHMNNSDTVVVAAVNDIVAVDENLQEALNAEEVVRTWNEGDGDYVDLRHINIQS